MTGEQTVIGRCDEVPVELHGGLTDEIAARGAELPEQAGGTAQAFPQRTLALRGAHDRNRGPRCCLKAQPNVLDIGGLDAQHGHRSRRSALQGAQQRIAALVRIVAPAQTGMGVVGRRPPEVRERRPCLRRHARAKRRQGGG